MPPQRRKPRRARRTPRPRTNGGWAVPGYRSALQSGFPRLPANNGADMKACCALSNPFDPACRGCKWPDGQNDNSIPYFVRSLYTFKCDASGNLAVALSPTVAGAFLSGTVAAGTITWAAAYTAAPVAASFTNASSFRPVCAGVRVCCTSAVPDTSGELVVTTHSLAPSVNGTRPEILLDGNEVQTFPLSTGSQRTILFRPVGTNGRSFYSVGTTNNSWSTIILEITGGVASKTAITIELVMAVELLYFTSGYEDLSPKDPPVNPKVTAAVQSF